MSEAQPVVRITSRLHPAGRLYAFRPVSSMRREELLELVGLHDEASRLARSPGRVAWLRMRRVLGRGCRIVLPTLELPVLLGLSADARERILTTWAEVAA